MILWLIDRTVAVCRTRVGRQTPVERSIEIFRRSEPSVRRLFSLYPTGQFGELLVAGRLQAAIGKIDLLAIGRLFADYEELLAQDAPSERQAQISANENIGRRHA